MTSLLSLLIYKNSMSLQLLGLRFPSSAYCNFQHADFQHTCFTSLTPKRFICFGAVISGIVFFVLPSSCLLLEHRNAMDFMG